MFYLVSRFFNDFQPIIRTTRHDESEQRASRNRHRIQRFKFKRYSSRTQKERVKGKVDFL